MGRGTTVTYTTQGWTYDGVQPWPINQLVAVRDNWVGLNMELLIVSATFNLDERGTTTELKCARPEGYELIEIPEPTSGQSWLAE